MLLYYDKELTKQKEKSPIMTQRKKERLSLQGLDQQRIVLENLGTVNSSEAGLLFLGNFYARRIN